jgi:8-oxo-dGTP pyrophosphatase MutT (NUDIX family)
VRAWLCDWKRGKERVLLGKRAENDSSPNLYEAFGGTCDLKETVLEALIREFWEETALLEIIVEVMVQSHRRSSTFDFQQKVNM